MELVQDNKSLLKIAKVLKKNEVLFVDTEFLRNNTYWPKLCLVQIKAKKNVYLIDTLAIGMDLSVLTAIFINPKILKVFHSARQDMEVLINIFNEIPWPIFYTQLAANLTIKENDVGYGNLVEIICKKKLSKKYQVSDWSKRPLKDKQIEYAALDVEYLPALYKELYRKIRSKRKVRLLKVETEKLKAVSEIYDIKLAYKKINLRKKNVIKSKVKLFTEWREASAQELNLPRNWVISDKTIISASKKYFEINNLKASNKNKRFDQKINSFKEFLLKKIIS